MRLMANVAKASGGRCANIETCRTCAKCDFDDDDTKWVHLFQPMRYADQMEGIRVELEAWKLQIEHNDGLPQKICTDCYMKLYTVCKFRRKCQKIQLILKENFSSHSRNLMENTALNGLDIDKNAKDLFLVLIEHNDGLPQKICTDCYMKLYTVCKFRRKCQKIQLILKENFSSHSRNLMENTALNGLDIDKNAKVNICAKEFTAVKSVPVQDLDTGADLSNSSQDLTVLPNDFDFSDLDDPDFDFESIEDLIEEEESVPESKSNSNVLLCNIYSETAAISNVNTQCAPPSSFTMGITRTTQVTATLTEEALLATNDNSFFTCQTPGTAHKPTNIEFETVANEKISNEGLAFTFECKYCHSAASDGTAAQFETENNMLDHIAAAHDPINPFDCPYCDEKYPDAPSRTVHIKHQHVSKQHECATCGKKYADVSNLRHHIDKYHNKLEYDCSICAKKFPSKKALKYHTRWHVPENQLKCGFCDRIFINERQRKVHEVTHTGIRSLEYCTFCGKSFCHIKALRWHIYRNHGGEKPFKCTLCTSALFESYKEKRLHMLEKHSKNLTAKEKSECMLCQKMFADEFDLREHLQSHQEDNNSIPIVNDKRVVQTKKAKQYSGVFHCQECPQRFNLQSALVRHSVVHNIEGRPHACLECKKRFKRLPDLKWHMKTHSTEKPNVCDICGKGFALKYVLTQHRKSHEALQRCFQCTTCGRTYLFEKSLRLHERVHTGKTYYACDLCGAKFVTHIKFLCHMRKLHGEQNNKNQNLLSDENAD